MNVSKTKRWLLWPIAILVILLIAIAISPSVPLISIKHQHTGWSIDTRPISDVFRQGLTGIGADFIKHEFETDNYTDALRSCPNRIGHHYGLFTINNFYIWDDSTAKQCDSARAKIQSSKGTLAAALLDGNPKNVANKLGNTIVTKDILPVVLSEIGEPMRTQLAQLMQMNKEQNAAIKKFDVALAVNDINYAKRWVPKKGINNYQRYALYKLGEMELIKNHSSEYDESATPMFGFGQDTNNIIDGFRKSDYYTANGHCDAKYADFLLKKGIKADEEVVIQAFFSRLFFETPNTDMDTNYNNYRLPIHAVRASKNECEDLVAQYKKVEISPEVLDDISNLVASQMLTKYHQLANKQMAGKEFKTADQEDKFYEELEFNQKTSPLPILPSMYTKLLQDRPAPEAVCAALDTMPWLVSHKEGIEKFMQLASVWRKTKIEDTDYLEDQYNCSPGLLMPPSLFAQETKERNEFLHKAGLNCRVVTPDQQYVYSQYVECGDGK